MLQRPLAGVFILLLIMFQFGKALNYMSCQFNSMLGNAPTCDCEKQIKQDIINDRQPISLKIVFKEIPEDLISVTSGNSSEAVFPLTISGNHDFLQGILPNGIHPSIFQPPPR